MAHSWPSHRVRRVLDLHARQIAKLDRLTGDGKRAGDHCLRCDHRGAVAKTPVVVATSQAPAGRKGWTRLLHRPAPTTLTEIVQHQARHHQPEPRQANRPRTKVPHVGIQCFPAGQRKKHRAENDERLSRLSDAVAQCIQRIQRQQHTGPAHDLHKPEHAEHQEPHHHDGAEYLAHTRGPLALHAEQPD